MKTKTKILITVALILLFCLILGSVLYIFLEYLPEKRERENLAAAMEEYYNTKVSAFEEENKSYLAGEVDAVFLGDSLTDGCDLGVYYPGIVALNRGIGGDTTFGLERRLQVSVYDVEPRVVVMLIGANNFSTMFENYEDILVGLGENLPDSEIVLVSLTSMGGNWGRNNELAAYNNVKIRALAEKYGYHYVDVYTPLLNMETDEIYEEYTTDGGHLTTLGYEVLTGEIRPVVESLLGRE